MSWISFLNTYSFSMICDVCYAHTINIPLTPFFSLLKHVLFNFCIEMNFNFFFVFLFSIWIAEFYKFHMIRAFLNRCFHIVFSVVCSFFFFWFQQHKFLSFDSNFNGVVFFKDNFAVKNKMLNKLLHSKHNGGIWNKTQYECFYLFFQKCNKKKMLFLLWRHFWNIIPEMSFKCS
jgi:hypothetical protein